MAQPDSEGESETVSETEIWKDNPAFEGEKNSTSQPELESPTSAAVLKAAELRQRLQNLDKRTRDSVIQIEGEEKNLNFLPYPKKLSNMSLPDNSGFLERNPATDLVFSLRSKYYQDGSLQDDLGNRFKAVSCSAAVESSSRYQYWDFQGGYLKLLPPTKIVLEDQYTLLMLVRWSDNELDWRIPFRSKCGIDLVAVEPKTGIIGSRSKDVFYDCQKAKVNEGRNKNKWHLIVVTGQKMANQKTYSTFWMGTRKSKIRKIGTIPFSASGKEIKSIGHFVGKVRDIFIWNQLLQPAQILKLWKDYFSKQNNMSMPSRSIQVNPWFPEKHKPGSKEKKISSSKKKAVAPKKDISVKQTEEDEINETKMFAEQREWTPEDNQMSLPEESDVRLPDVRESMENVVLYETSAHFILVGSNKSRTRFRLLKIKRDCDDKDYKLQITEMPVVYSEQEIASTLDMVRGGNLQGHTGGLTTCKSACGIVGFVKFVEGYYVVLITERQKVGNIGPHIVYKISKTATVSITSPPKQDKLTAKTLRNDEARYRNLFSIIDLKNEFYFSYTLDISRNLQENMCNHHTSGPRNIFIWNEFLMTELRRQVNCKLWQLPIIHGYFEQRITSVCGREVTLTLMSRRSKMFAGTRYLKRGINNNGCSANDVETEQILHDRVGGDPLDGQFVSHVQMRASIPLFWSQESNAMVARPDIVIQRFDPRYHAVRKHFLSIFRRYGAPVLVLNLIKQTEPKARETILGPPYEEALRYVNEFLPQEYKIDFHSLDYKMMQKHREQNVVDELDKLAHWGLQRTGIFHSAPSAEAIANYQRNTSSVRPTDDKENNRPSKGKRFKETQMPKTKRFRNPEKTNVRVYDIGCFQNGVVRSNCIDSLDRTNVAQFCTGKCALGYQLYTLGVHLTPYLNSESEIIRVLLEMYERMGDCIAYQYGGSMMHRAMKKDKVQAETIAPVLYRQKEATTKPKEMLVSLMRHYQNSFQDNVKQDAMNLFLGVFRPSAVPQSEKLWELVSDYYLHNSHPTLDPFEPLSLGRPWWEDAINEFRSTFIRCERKRKRLMEQKREGSRIFYQNRPKTERIRRRYINRLFNNLHGSSNELVFFDDPKNKLNSYVITLQPNTGMEDTETRRLDSQVAIISTNQTERIISALNPVSSADSQADAIDEFEPPPPQFSTETPASIKRRRAITLGEELKNVSSANQEIIDSDILQDDVTRGYGQRNIWSRLVDNMNPFRLFRRTQDINKSQQNNNLDNNVNQGQIDNERYVPRYGEPDRYYSETQDGKNVLALPHAVLLENESQKRLVEQLERRCNFDLDSYVITEHEVAVNFPSTKEVARKSKDLEKYVGSKMRPNIPFDQPHYDYYATLQENVKFDSREDEFFYRINRIHETPYEIPQPHCRAEQYASYFTNPATICHRSINPTNLPAYENCEPFFLLTSRERSRVLNNGDLRKRSHARTVN